MNLYVVGSPMVIGAFEVIGVAGCVPEPGQDIGELLTHLARHQGVELALVQSRFAAGVSEEVLDELNRRWGCLVQEIPDFGEAAPDPERFVRMVRSAVGGAI